MKHIPRPSPVLRRLTLATCVMTALLSGCGGEEPSSDSADAATGESGGRAQAMGSSRDRTRSLMTVIALRAKTTMADGTGAFIKLRYNGAVIASGELRSTTITDMVFRVSTPISNGILDVIFTNATHPNGEVARELTVSEVIVNGTPFSPNGPGVVYDTGHHHEAFDGINLIPATDRMTQTGALRFSMPDASGLGPQQSLESTMASPSPGLYVDPWAGVDSHTGMFERPLRTMAGVQTVPLLPGENIHLRCGGVWRESLLLTNSNLSDGTEIKPYGSCDSNSKPVITGGEDFKGSWSRSAANPQIWVRDVPAGTPKVKRLVIGYQAMRTAQWPNADSSPAVATGGAPAALVVSSAHAQMLAGKDLANASIMLRVQPWKVEPRQLTAAGMVGNTMNVDSPTEYPLQAGVTYVLRDKPWMLDAPGEFFHDKDNNKLYLYPTAEQTSQGVNTLAMEGSVRDVALELRDRRHLVVRDIAVRMTRGDGIRLVNAPDALLTNVEATDHAAAGVRFFQWNEVPADAKGPTLQNSFVSGNGEFGVDARYADHSRVLNNRIMDIGVADYTDNVDSAVVVGPGGRVENNVINNIGFTAVRFSALRGSVIADNEIRDYCRRLADCGAIYTWTGTPNHPLAAGSIVERNRIHPAVSVTAGSVPWGHNGLFGVYIDDFSNGVTVRDNFIHGAEVGIFVHNANTVTVERNKVWMPRSTGVAVDMDATNFDFATNINVRHNEVVPYTSTSGAWPEPPKFHSTHAFSMVNFVSGEGAFGPGRVDFRNNRVIQLHGSNAEHARVQTRSTNRTVTEAVWRQLNPGEPPIEQPVTFSSYWVLLGAETVSGGDFDAGLGTWGLNYNWQIPGFDLQNVPAQQGCNGPCVRMTTASPGDMIHSPVFPLNSSKLYMYRLTAVAAGAAAEIGWPYISRAGWPWDEMQDSRGFQGRSTREIKAGSTLRWEAFFRPKANDSARVNLTLSTLAVPVHFDSVSVREVSMWLASGPSEWVAPVVAERNSARLVTSCGDIGLPANCTVANLNGASVGFPFSVPANQHQLLLWTNSPYRQP